ncbi:peptidase, partial [Genlisea aurea]
FLFLLLLFRSITVFAGDIVHVDDKGPKRPGCDNNFVLIKVPVWVDGEEEMQFVGVGARFGPTLESQEKRADRITVALADPPDCCSNPKKKLIGEAILVHRGNCSFVTKANVAEEAGASAVIIINNQTDLMKMVCNANEMDLTIGIPVVMLPQDAGESLKSFMAMSSRVSIQIYSPKRPLFDVAEVFLWLMAVGTIICASYWSALTARKEAIELEKLLKLSRPTVDDFETKEKQRDSSSGVLEINIASAICFVVLASCFLLMLYKLMSSLFIRILVFLLCFGGFQGLLHCSVFLLGRLRWCEPAAECYVGVPFVGPVSYLALAAAPFCLALAVLWGLFRTASYAWIGQDILGISLMVAVLQFVHVPNLKVGTVLLACALLYDIFWVFLSKLWFNKSVMIAVS